MEFIEFLEVAINQFLYLRSVYPAQIFKLQKAFGLPVYISIYPPLNTYISTSLEQAEDLLNADKLDKLELRLLNRDEIYEKFFISKSSVLLESLDDTFRSFIHCLNSRCKTLRKLPKDCRFKLLLHARSFNLSNETLDENSLWMRDQQPKLAAGKIVPLLMNPSVMNSINCYIEQFKPNIDEKN